MMAITTSCLHGAALHFLFSLPVIHAVDCFNKRVVSYVCGPGEECCGSTCCPASGPFYRHWYFWLAVFMLLLGLVGLVISACRHYRKMRTQNEHSTITVVERSKPKAKLGNDLLLNYHLTRMGTTKEPLCGPKDAKGRDVILPLYSDVTIMLPSYDDLEKGRHVMLPMRSWLPPPFSEVTHLPVLLEETAGGLPPSYDDATQHDVIRE